MNAKLNSFNAGNSIGYSPNPNDTGPVYVGAVGSTAAPIHLPSSWSVERTPGEAVGWYRITHSLNAVLYFVLSSTRNNPKTVAVPTNYTPNYFDINVAELPSGNNVDRDFTFLVTAQPSL